jgi:hypothetical protein
VGLIGKPSSGMTYPAVSKAITRTKQPRQRDRDLCNSAKKAETLMSYVQT